MKVAAERGFLSALAGNQVIGSIQQSPHGSVVLGSILTTLIWNCTRHLVWLKR